jgi:hypothetical protein
MANTSNLRVTELDFDSIKSNLKTFLQSQSEFTDYDFEGSSLSVLLDILAYNTHYNAIYANFVANEMYLDTATKRSSVVSLAKHFGYTPRSVRSPIAKINLSVTTTGNPQSLLLPSNTAFVTTIDGIDYTFYNRTNVIVPPVSANTFYFPNVTIVEGTPLTYRYTVSNDQNKFILPNKNIDTTTLLVEVQTSGVNANRDTYVLADEIVAVSSTDKTYFLEMTREGYYQLVFGDDTIGKKLLNGNIVHISYLVSSAASANNATSFTLQTGAGFSVSSSTITLVQKASGGRAEETVESIRFNAAKYFTTQNRAVTAEDYKNILLNEYSDIDAISAWGGDVNDPPIYGKVYISAKPTNGLVLSDQLKDELSRVLNKKNVVGITPEFVDPEYLYVAVDTKIFYDPSKTTQGKETLEANVFSSIVNYRDSDLDNFDAIFRRSKLARQIDYTNKSILNNNTEISLYKILNINTETAVNYTINFVNPIRRITSTEFRLFNDSTSYYLEDDGDSNIRRFHYVNGDKVIDSSTFGTVDYKSGTIKIPTTAFSLLTDNCKIKAEPATQDISGVRNQIVTILNNDISVLAEPDIRKPLIK